MKKIITAAAVAAMAASFAAAETKFSVNYRTGIDLLQHSVMDSKGKSHGTYLFDNQASGRGTSVRSLSKALQSTADSSLRLILSGTKVLSKNHRH